MYYIIPYILHDVPFHVLALLFDMTLYYIFKIVYNIICYSVLLDSILFYASLLILLYGIILCFTFLHYAVICYYKSAVYYVILSCIIS